MNSIPFQFVRVSIPVFMKKKLIDIKSESIYGIFYHSAMWITVICMVNLFEPIVIRFTSIFKYIC